MSRHPVAVYARVSTKDGRQDYNNQLRDIGDLCHRRNWVITAEYVDTESGAKSDRERPELRRLLHDARRSRKFGRVIVWSLDRLTREGIAKTFEYLEYFTANDVSFTSYTEPEFTTDGPGGRLLIAIAAWIAEQERRRLTERINSGIANARAKGKTLGRPRQDLAAAAIAQTDHLTVRAAAAVLNVSPATVQRRRRTGTQPQERNT